jgi:hypothetical protein
MEMINASGEAGYITARRALIPEHRSLNIFMASLAPSNSPVRFRFAFGSFFQPSSVFNNFSASLSGSFPVRFWLSM